ncbi:MAG: DUF2800 domain-containing protein [Aeromonas sp.]
MRPPKVSDAGQWMVCNGSVKAQQDFPAPAGEISESKLEGRAIHETAQNMLQALKGDPNAPLTGIVGTLSQDGIVITQELYDAAREYVNEVWGYANRRGLFKEVKVEDRVSLEHLIPDWFTVVDAHLIDYEKRTITVWECKGGHRLVEAEDNWQLFIEAHGIFKRMWLNVNERHGWSFDLRVVQPRGFHRHGPVRPWLFNHDTYTEKLEHVTSTVERIVSGNVTTCAGSHCRDCSAGVSCVSFTYASFSAMEYVKELTTNTPSNDQLGVQLKMIRKVREMLDARETTLEAQALYQMRKGNIVPFFTMEQGKGRETWRKNVPVEQLIMMGDLLGVDIRKPVTLDTPAQCRKKGIDESVIAEYIETPSTGLKLVEFDSKEYRHIFTRGL